MNNTACERKPFNILVIGSYCVGKKTLVNALLGMDILPRSHCAYHVFPITVEYGSCENTVQIFETGKPQPRILSREQFENEFVQRAEEYEGNEALYPCFDHAIVQSNSPQLQSNVRITVFPLPGSPHSYFDMKKLEQYSAEADAIIFVLNAPVLFSAVERTYINDNFVGRGLRNVFFVVNNIDRLSDPNVLETVVKPAVRTQLEGVFTDKNGRFEEELFNKRVFYTNAYGALCIRTGEPYTVYVGRIAVPVPIEIEETGILEFEQAFEEYRYRQREGLVRLSRMMQGRRGI